MKEEDKTVAVSLDMVTLYIDAFSVIPWTDDLIMVCGHQRGPTGKMYERMRYLTTPERSKLLIDNLCKALDYYPERDHPPKEEVIPVPKEFKQISRKE